MPARRFQCCRGKLARSACYRDPVFRSSNRSSPPASLGLSFRLLIAMPVNKPQFPSDNE
nr:hypothetical protein Q903MT_gene5020 [Picea sitchensis]